MHANSCVHMQESTCTHSRLRVQVCVQQRAPHKSESEGETEMETEAIEREGIYLEC